jgi:head-tail adaptor
MALPGPKTTMILQVVTRTADSMGSFTTTYATAATLTGVLTKLRGRTVTGTERVNLGGRETVYADYTFFIDYSSALTINERNYRFLYGTRIFDIVFVYQPGNAKHHYEIDLREVGF